MSIQSKLWFFQLSWTMWDLDHKEGWAPKNWCFWIVVLEKTLQSPLDCKELKPVNPKGNQPWIFIGRTDVEAEAPILWLPDAKSQLIGKDPDAGKDWRQEEKRTMEDEIVGWHHRLSAHKFEQTLGRTWVSDWITMFLFFFFFHCSSSLVVVWYTGKDLRL